jgi:prepilin-type N-terminal cleavage/methylation domain-containing protein
MHPRAFTLLELVLVVAVMATLAGTVVVLAEDTHATVDQGLVQREALALREAVLRFHADTGWLPGEGPFDLADGAPGRHAQASVAPARVQGEGVPAGQEAAWFDSAANVWQLLESPLPAGHPLAAWDPDRRRGWHGPYLAMSAEGRVRASALDARALPPAADHSVLLALAPAVADPFQVACPAANQPGYWETLGGAPLARQGRPLLLLLPRDGAGRVVRRTPDLADAPRVVSLGPDGALGGADDTVVYLFQ